jgi:hypothetical protein
MSYQLTTPCNTCGQPSSSCSCPRIPHPLLPQGVQFQTPRRPQYQPTIFSQAATPNLRPPTVPHYASSFSQLVYDARMYPGYYPPFPYSQMPTRPPATPAQTIPTFTVTRQPLADRADIPSPAQPSLEASRTGTKRKRMNGATTASKRLRRAQQTNVRAEDENTNPSSIPESVSGVGPLSAPVQLPATRPHPIIDYSPILKTNKKVEPKQAATDVWYFVRPLEKREKPTVMEVLPRLEPLSKKPKSPFVGCCLCKL